MNVKISHDPRYDRFSKAVTAAAKAENLSYGEIIAQTMSIAVHVVTLSQLSEPEMREMIDHIAVGLHETLTVYLRHAHQLKENKA